MELVSCSVKFSSFDIDNLWVRETLNDLRCYFRETIEPPKRLSLAQRNQWLTRQELEILTERARMLPDRMSVTVDGVQDANFLAEAHGLRPLRAYILLSSHSRLNLLFTKSLIFDSGDSGLWQPAHLDDSDPSRMIAVRTHGNEDYTQEPRPQEIIQAILPEGLDYDV